MIKAIIFLLFVTLGISQENIKIQDQPDLKQIQHEIKEQLKEQQNIPMQKKQPVKVEIQDILKMVTQNQNQIKNNQQPIKQQKEYDDIKEIQNIMDVQNQNKINDYGQQINLQQQNPNHFDSQDLQNIPYQDLQDVTYQDLQDIPYQDFIDEYQQQSIPEWILQQQNKNQQANSLYVEESFSFLIQSKGQKLFKWDPSRQRNLSLQIYVYLVTDVGDIAIPESQSRQKCIQVFTKKHQKGTFYHHDYVYVHSIISINFDTDYRILRFTNNYDDFALLSIDLQFPGKIIQKGLDDDQLFDTKIKIDSILKQVKNTELKREHQHKLSVGFFSYEISHEHVLLVLTGVELIAILSAVFVQMLWIKSLIENRQII